MMNDARFTALPASRHIRGLYLSTLDLFPDWVHVSSEAARQNSEGKGPYASLRFSWDDLRRLHVPLTHVSTIFARSCRQQESLSAALAKFDNVSAPMPLEDSLTPKRLSHLPHDVPIPVGVLSQEKIQKADKRPRRWCKPL